VLYEKSVQVSNSISFVNLCHVDLTGGSERSENGLTQLISRISAFCHDHAPEVVVMCRLAQYW
jgi:hypothetical protein